MKIGARIAFEGKIYHCVDRELEESEFAEFLMKLDTNRAVAINELSLAPGEDGAKVGIQEISLHLGKEAAERAGVFIITYK